MRVEGRPQFAVIPLPAAYAALKHIIKFDKQPEVQCPKGEFHSHPFSSFALNILIKRMREDCLSHRA
jgi:hypothetical protein